MIMVNMMSKDVLYSFIALKIKMQTRCQIGFPFVQNGCPEKGLPSLHISYTEAMECDSLPYGCYQKQHNNEDAFDNPVGTFFFFFLGCCSYFFYL